MANINTITPILKERYGPRIVEQLENYTEFTKRLTKDSSGISSDFGGKYVTFPIHVGRNSGIGSRFEDEVLPAAGSQKYDGVRTGLKFAYGAIRVTGPSIALSDENPKAFAKVITEETDGVVRDLGRDFNRQLFGTGSGALATFDAAVTADDEATVGSTRGVGVDDLVDIYDTSGATTSTGVRVLAVDHSTNTVTFDGNVTVAIGDYMTRAGSGADAVKGNREITGLGAIVDDSSMLYNLDPATQPIWKSTVRQYPQSGDPTIEDEMTLMVDDIYSLGGKTNLIVTTQAVRREYAKELMTLRTTMNRTNHEGGFSGLKFVTDGPSGEVDILVDLDCPAGDMIFLDMNDLTLYRDKAWDWLDRDGSMWKQEVSGGGAKDAWRAEIAQYHELGISRRNTHGRLTDVA